MLNVRVQKVQCVVLVSWFYVRRSRTITDQPSKQQTPTYLRQGISLRCEPVVLQYTEMRPLTWRVT